MRLRRGQRHLAPQPASEKRVGDCPCAWPRARDQSTLVQPSRRPPSFVAFGFGLRALVGPNAPREAVENVSAKTVHRTGMLHRPPRQAIVEAEHQVPQLESASGPLREL